VPCRKFSVNTLDTWIQNYACDAANVVAHSFPPQYDITCLHQKLTENAFEVRPRRIWVHELFFTPMLRAPGLAFTDDQSRLRSPFFFLNISVARRSVNDLRRWNNNCIIVCCKLGNLGFKWVLYILPVKLNLCLGYYTSLSIRSH